MSIPPGRHNENLRQVPGRTGLKERKGVVDKETSSIDSIQYKNLE
jgi:hypothetical protein